MIQFPSFSNWRHNFMMFLLRLMISCSHAGCVCVAEWLCCINGSVFSHSSCFTVAWFAPPCLTLVRWQHLFSSDIGRKVNYTMNSESSALFVVILSTRHWRWQRQCDQITCYCIELHFVEAPPACSMQVLHFNHHHTPQPFYGPFSGTTRVSRCQ